MKTPDQTLAFDNTEIAFRHYSDSQLKKSYRIFKLLGYELLNDFGVTLTEFALAMHLPISPIVKPLIYTVFCGGETLEETKKTAAMLYGRNMRAFLNYGVEGLDSLDSIENILKINLDALHFSSGNAGVIGIPCKPSSFGKFELLRKKQNGHSFTDLEQKEYDEMLARMDLICKTASENNALVYWDSEETWAQEAINDIVDALMEKYNKEKAVVFNTFQMYVHYKLAFLEKSIARAEKKGYILGAKIVRGAYMEKERERAKEEKRIDPIHKTKADTDKDYDAAIAVCIKNVNHTAVCVASHNEESNMKAVQQMAAQGLEKNHENVYFSQLYGMGDHISFNLAEAGYNATKYLPYGPVKEVIPYLIRRADENSSIDGQMGRELSMFKKEIDRRGI